ncbi:MAG: hypothetical protein JWO82_2249 [Akkermansiaceae bacterium]|nr:hypothetical protein [Akkermansiaceae bacterium]
MQFRSRPAVSLREVRIPREVNEKVVRYLPRATGGIRMSVKNQKQFGVWMDSHRATVVGQADPSSEEFSVLGHVKNPGADGNSSESAAQHQAQTLLHHYFKEIAGHLTNAEEVHITGTGTAQEQFIHFLAETPQFKNTTTTESTSNPTSDEGLVELISGKFN